MRYQVPQFIEVEDKIFGPFTFRQFIYLVGGGGICFIIYQVTGSLWLGAPFMLVVAAISGSLAFYKVNNRPLIDTVEAAFKFLFTKRIYVWQKKDKPVQKSVADQMLEQKTNQLYVPKVSGSKLKDLAWSLDINETTQVNTKEQPGSSLRDTFKQ